MSNRAAPIDRPGARVILLDDTDRVLLFSSPMPDGESAGRLWVPPGGAVEAGEDWDAATRRELREETGFDLPLGPCLWVREHVWYWAVRGAWYRSIERFFLARTRAGAIDVTGWTSEEKRVVTDWHWWTVDELCATTDVLVPRRLGELLPPILGGLVPPSPVVLVE